MGGEGGWGERGGGGEGGVGGGGRGLLGETCERDLDFSSKQRDKDKYPPNRYSGCEQR